MSQGASHKVSLRAVMASRAFSVGFNDYRNGLPWRDDNAQRALPSSACAGGAWSYERGRLFAALYPKPIREGRRLSADAYRAFATSYHNRDII